jgi:acetyl-CoA carboxylase biotin carboxyl carrier protein
VNLEQIKELIANLENSKLKKLVIKQGEFELQLEKEGDSLPLHSLPHLPPHYQPPRVVHAEFASNASTHLLEEAKSAPSVGVVQEGKFVTSPMVGTFYPNPSPDQPPFVKVGDKVDENTVVCIIEAMKVMNEVKAGKSGTVAEILVNNAQPVEYGTKILRIV